MNKDYRLYILMRTDLPSMSDGRKMAQASHASNALTHEWDFYSKYGRGDVAEWTRQTKQGFGTAIILGATIDDINKLMKCPWTVKGIVTDPEYGIKTTTEMLALMDKRKLLSDKTIINEDGSAVIFKSEVTCAYIFGTKEELEPFVGHLNLHP